MHYLNIHIRRANGVVAAQMNGCGGIGRWTHLRRRRGTNSCLRRQFNKSVIIAVFVKLVAGDVAAGQSAICLAKKGVQASGIL
jgi:hypothetical protein